MNTTIFVPKTINVGYQNRNGTYTGKLAYVVYTDNKGKLRKEASWNSWRDHNIEPNAFDNVPTSGFVLNKKVGDYVSDWNHRQAYCRVYDPRDFEFEITIENLLYILENANSIKGKGLEGEFVYGWDGKDLILIPVESPDYKQIAEYNSLIHNNLSIKGKDLIIGATYLTKNNTELIYIGRYDYYSSGYEWIEDGEVKRSKNSIDVPNEYNSRLCRYSSVPYKYIPNFPYGKHYWFAYKEYDYTYKNGTRINKDTYKWGFKTFKSIPTGTLIKCLDENCTSEYSDIYEVLESTQNYSPYDSSKDVLCDMSLEDFLALGKRNSDYYHNFKFISNVNSDETLKTYLADSCCGENRGKYNIYAYQDSSKNIGCYGYAVGYDIKVQPYKTLEEIYDIMKPKYIQRYLSNGRIYEKEYEINEYKQR